MSIRINERWKFGQRTIELFDKASGHRAEIVIEPNGNIHELGDLTLIRIFKKKKLNYSSLSDYKSKREWLKSKNP